MGVGWSVMGILKTLKNSLWIVGSKFRASSIVQTVIAKQTVGTLCKYAILSARTY